LQCKNVANILGSPAVGETLFNASDETRKLSVGEGGKSLKCKNVANTLGGPAVERLYPLPLMKKESLSEGQGQKLAVQKVECGGGAKGQKLAVQKCGKHFRQSCSWKDFAHCL
jgi:hypothetical protein